MRFKLLKSLTTFVIAVVLVFLPLNMLPAGAETVAELRARYNTLEKESYELSLQLQELKDEQTKQQEYLNTLLEQIDATKEQIAELNRQINTLNEQITQKEDDIERNQAEISRRFELLKKRLRAMYMNGSFSGLEIFLGADSFAQYLSQSAIAQSIAGHDKDLMDSISQDIRQIDSDKRQIESDKASVEQARDALDDKRVQLNAQINESQEIMDKLGIERKELDQSLVETEEAIAEAEELLKKALQDSTPPDWPVIWEDNGFLWPVPGHIGISSPYGDTEGRSSPHSGVDISDGSIAMADIIASAGGYVRVSGAYGGYGNCVIIEHGSGYTTLYAHCAVLVAEKGKNVKQGDVIALVGSTGFSTGDHLHFEIWQDGIHQNPMDYFTKKER